jgi:hypothetical protein
VSDKQLADKAESDARCAAQAETTKAQDRQSNGKPYLDRSRPPAPLGEAKIHFCGLSFRSLYHSPMCHRNPSKGVAPTG